MLGARFYNLYFRVEYFDFDIESLLSGPLPADDTTILRDMRTAVQGLEHALRVNGR